MKAGGKNRNTKDPSREEMVDRLNEVIKRSEAQKKILRKILNQLIKQEKDSGKSAL